MSPNISDFTVIPIKSELRSSLGIYVVEINKGTTAHQAKDKLYYARRNFKNDSLTNSEIDDIRNRTKKIDVIIKLNLIDKSTKIPKLSSKNKQDQKDLILNYRIEILVENTGQSLIHNIQCFMNYYSEFRKEEINEVFENSSRDEYTFNSGTNKSTIIGSKYYNPLHIQTYQKLGEFEISKKDLYSDQILNILLCMDNAKPKRQNIKLCHLRNKK